MIWETFGRKLLERAITGNSEGKFVKRVLEDSSWRNLSKTSHEETKTIKLVLANLKSIKYVCKRIALKRCIINLINNAKAFGDKILVNLDQSNKEIKITIEDNGPGIPKKDYEKALKPFQRLDSSRNQNIAGSGLGLSISQEIINSIGGTIKLSKSNLGGLKVIVALPLKNNI